MNRSRFAPPSITGPLDEAEFRRRLEATGTIQARGSDSRPLPDETAVASFVASAMRQRGAIGPLRVERGDPIDRLPPAAATKLRHLRNGHSDANVLLQSLSERKTDAMRRKQRYEMRLRELTEDEAAARAGVVPIARERIRSGHPDGHIPPDDQHPSVLEARRQIEATAGEMAEIDQRIAVLSAGRWGGMRRLETYLQSLAGLIAEHDGAVDVPKKLTLEAARDRIAHIKADIHEAQSAAYPSAVVKAHIRSEIANLAARGAPHVMPAIEAAAPLRWPLLPVRGEIGMADGARGFTTGEIPDALALVAWLHKDALLAKLDTEVDFYADDENALTDAERANRITALHAKLLDAERVEEALVCASEAAGVSILRRTDADPRAVLGLSSALPPAR